MLWVGIAAACLLSLWVFLVAPGRTPKTALAPFLSRAFAHRGLFLPDQSVPENSLPAFRAAAEAGYGIELDVALSADGEVFVFHDATLDRACGVPGRADEKPFCELSALPLFQTEYTIPLFSEALQAVGGRVPLIVELKAGKNWRELCEKTLALLRAYQGEFCIESFDPFLVRWFKRHAPDVVRGQLSEAYRFSSKSLKPHLAFFVSRCFGNAWTRPHFIAYRLGPKCPSVRLAERLGAMRVVWTVRTETEFAAERRQADCIIFEHIRPELRF